MKSSTLKNIVRREIKDPNGAVVSWEVLDDSGTPIPACTLFIRKLEGYAFTTRKRYVEAICRFVDYLYEAKVLGSFDDATTLPSRQFVNEVIDEYIPFVLKGSDVTIATHTLTANVTSNKQWLVSVAKALKASPCKKKSLDNLISPLNHFLRFSESLALEARDLAELYGVEIPAEYTPLINAINGFSKLSPSERKGIRSSNMLGGVIRMHGEIRRPARIKNSGQKPQVDRTVFDFPVEHMEALLTNATNWRDRTLWLLLLASGIRKSEAMNLQWSDIDYKNRRVYVLDPKNRRYGRFLTAEEKIRFKGRAVSWTYLFEPWRSKFFEALAEYRKREWRLPSDGNGYVFQKLSTIGGQVGIPLLHASDASLNQSFKEAVKRAGIPSPNMTDEHSWTPHSLRHAYGVHMLNYIQIAQGVFGFPETDVQALMGHESLNSTRKYARRKQDILESKLLYADQIALGFPVANNCLVNQPDEQKMLPPILASRILTSLKLKHD